MRLQIRLLEERYRYPLIIFGFEVPDNYIVGFGFDIDNNYRNLPYVAYLEG